MELFQKAGRVVSLHIGENMPLRDICYKYDVSMLFCLTALRLYRGEYGHQLESLLKGERFFDEYRAKNLHIQFSDTLYLEQCL